ncbi:MAG TPA: DUF2298 domain-containing protein, partial [Thermomicrobiaceae bacterium]|nr:DUF2298 domain-containing protein [Thermomicrobiaceae bacterium]
GILIGAALATKVSVFALAVPVAAALLLAYRQHGRPRSLVLALRRLVWAAAAAVVAFALFEPYALWQPRAFFNDISGQWKMANGTADLPYTRQFVGTIPVRYELGNLIHWGLGPLFGITALVALVAVLRRGRRMRAGEIILLGWIIPYFALISTAEVKYLRYAEPIVPALAILTGGLLAGLITRWPVRSWRGVVSITLAGVVLLGTAGWALAFESIYTKPNTHLAASDWIYRNIPPGSTITAEWWDDSLPLPLANMPPPQAAYKQITLDLYADRPNQQEFDYIAGFLRDSDYIILASDRLAQSIPQLPWRYPVASQYYRLLESGQLGYQLVYESEVVPSLGPLHVNDRDADESFTVYDHPHVRIYKKVTPLSRDQLQQRFASAIAQPWYPQRTPPRPTLLLSTPVDQQPAVSDLGWSASWTSHSLVAAAVWLLVITALGLLAIPATTVLFARANRPFADAGWGLARALGILIAGYAVWIAVSLQLVQFRLPDILLVLALTIGSEWLVLRRQVRQGLRELRARWRMVVLSEGLFLAAFAFFLLLRAINPDLWQTFWGGEKPMELSFIQAIARSAHFPPYDPWYAGGAMNYYYYGFYLMAMLWKITGIVPEIAFQLSIATISAMLVSTVFSLAATAGGDLLRTRRVRWLAGAGVCGVVIETFIGNLDAARQLLQRSAAAFDFWQSSRVVDFGITEFPYFTSIWADLHPHAINLPFTVLLLALVYAGIRQGLHRWWFAGTTLVLGSMMVINSWDMPYGLLIVAAAVLTALVRRYGWTWRALGLAPLAWGLTAGGAYLLFRPFFSHFVALVNGVARTSHGTALSQYSLHFGVMLGILGAAGAVVVVANWPRLDPRRRPLASLAGALLGLAGFGVAALALQQHSLGHFILGALVACAAGVAFFALFTGDASLPGPRTLWYAAAAAFALALGLLLPERTTAALLLLPLATGLRLWIGSLDDPAAAIAGIFILGASGITLGADLIYVVDDLNGTPWARMNTIFKFYVESWTLFALAAGLALIWLLFTARLTWSQPLGIVAGARGTHPPVDAATPLRTTQVARMALVVALCFVGLGFLYPIFGTPARLEQRMNGSPTGLTLNGLAWMKGSQLLNSTGQAIDFSGDYAAILWLRQHDHDNSVVLEASIGPYRGNGARIAAGTGLPVVLGWDRHERQQRYQPGIDQRLQDVRTIYAATDTRQKLALLRQYRVRYIVVGDVERWWRMPDGSLYAEPAGLAAFAQMVGSSLRVAFTSGHTTIYEVQPFPSVPPAPAARLQP